MYPKTTFFYRWRAMGIHGDKNQSERDYVLRGKFKYVFSHYTPYHLTLCNIVNTIIQGLVN